MKRTQMPNNTLQRKQTHRFERCHCIDEFGQVAATASGACTKQAEHLEGSRVVRSESAGDLSGRRGGEGGEDYKNILDRKDDQFND